MRALGIFGVLILEKDLESTHQYAKLFAVVPGDGAKASQLRVAA